MRDSVKMSLKSHARLFLSSAKLPPYVPKKEHHCNANRRKTQGILLCHESNFVGKRLSKQGIGFNSN